MEKVNIGILVNTHGLRGEVKVKIITDFWEQRFAKQEIVYLQYKNEIIKLEIERARLHKGMLIVKFKEYDSINDVECFKGSTLFVQQDQLHELEEDEAYFFEIMNAKVYDLQQNELGQVVEIIETGANLVLRVQGACGEKLIPFVKAIVQEFDKNEKTMIVDLIEGL